MAFLTFDKKRNPRQANISLVALLILMIAFPFIASQFGNSWVRIMDIALLYIMLALGLEQGVLVAARVDFCQQVTGLDHLPFLEGDLDQLAAHPAAHINGVQCSDRPQGLVVHRKLPQHRRRHTHRYRPGGTTEAWARHAGLARVSRRSIFMGRATGPEFPAQAGYNQQHEQAKQPAAGVAGGGLHGVINHWG